MSFKFLDLLSQYENENVDVVKKILENKQKKIDSIMKEAFYGDFVTKTEALLKIKTEFLNEKKAPKTIDISFLKENFDEIVDKVEMLNEGDIKIIVNNYDAPKNGKATLPPIQAVMGDDEEEIDEANKPKKRGRPSKADKVALDVAKEVADKNEEVVEEIKEDEDEEVLDKEETEEKDEIEECGKDKKSSLKWEDFEKYTFDDEEKEEDGEDEIEEVKEEDDQEVVEEKLNINSETLKDDMVDLLMKEFSDKIENSDEMHMDIESAIYWFANDYHNGQDSELYSVLNTSKYKPGRSYKSVDDEDENVNDMYNFLVNQMVSIGESNEDDTDIEENEIVEDENSEDQEDSNKKDLPENMVKDYEKRAKAERRGGGSVEIDYKLPTVAVTLSDGSEYFFQEQEASDLLDEVPNNVSAEDYILATAQGW